MQSFIHTYIQYSSCMMATLHRSGRLVSVPIFSCFVLLIENGGSGCSIYCFIKALRLFTAMNDEIPIGII
jgi:hypothetical protein